jgi:hypothetical protein
MTFWIIGTEREVFVDGVLRGVVQMQIVLESITLHGIVFAKLDTNRLLQTIHVQT